MAEEEGSGLKCCAGICLLVIILFGVYLFLDDYDFDPTIQNNTTINLNGVTLTVPKTNNYTIIDNATLYHINDTDKFGMLSNVTKGNAYEYSDTEHDVYIYVSDNNRTAYAEEPEGRKIMDSDGSESARTYENIRHIGNKTIVSHVVEQKQLGTKIVNSATLT